MKKIFITSTLLIFFITVSNLQAANETNKTVNNLQGIISKVSIAKKQIFIKQDTRTIKFNASSNLCKEYQNKVNTKVNVTYVKNKNNSMDIKTIKIINDDYQATNDKANDKNEKLTKKSQRKAKK